MKLTVGKPELRLACAHCGKVVPLTRADQTYCSRRCKEQAHKKRVYDAKKEQEEKVA